MSERVQVALAEGVLTLSLNRPDKRNAMDTAMVDALHDGLDRADLDAAVHVVAVRGSGRDFCAGADLAELLASLDQTAERNARNAAHLGRVFVRMRELPKPVVAIVHGRALAGGCGLATACDLVLAHTDAQFGYPEIRRGFVPAMVMAILRRAVGEKVAFDLVTTGRILSAREARDLGLVARVVPGDSFDRDVDAFLATLAGASPSALSLIKRQLYELEGKTFREGIELGAQVNALARSAPDFAREVRGFLRKA